MSLTPIPSNRNEPSADYFYCRIGGCRDFIGGQTLTVKSPGMSWVGEEWNDKIVSYQCFHE